MEFIGISGSWRSTNIEMERAIREDVRSIIADGRGIVTGGALGTDFIATDEALKLAPDGSRIRIIIPTSLDIYIKHFLNRAKEGVITMEQALSLSTQLNAVREANPSALVEMEHTECNQCTYYDRNSKVIETCNELYAYRANNSAGTGDAINKAKALGKPVTVREYNIDPQVGHLR